MGYSIAYLTASLQGLLVHLNSALAHPVDGLESPRTVRELDMPCMRSAPHELPSGTGGVPLEIEGGRGHGR